MDKIFQGAGKLWKETKTTLKGGYEFVAGEVKDHLDVQDQNFLELEKDIKNMKIVAKKNLQAGKVLASAILQSSVYSLKIANELVQTFANDPQQHVAATQNLAAAQKSDSQFHMLCDNLIPQYMQQPFVNISESLKQINKERKKVRSYLLEKERLEKKLTDQMNRGNRDKVDQTRNELTEADREYARAYAELKPKVDATKVMLLNATKKAIKASVFYFGQFVNIVDQLQTAYNANAIPHVSLSNPFAIFQNPQANQVPSQQPPQYQVSYPDVSSPGIGIVAYPTVDPQVNLPPQQGYSLNDNPYADLIEPQPQPEPKPTPKRIATPA